METQTMADTRTASTRVALNDPHGVLHRLCAHFAEHGRVTMTERGGRIETEFGHAAIALELGALRIEAVGANDTALYVVKMSVAEHVFQLAGEDVAAFTWSGDSSGQLRIPFFREMTVRRARNVTPLMRRVTLACEDVAHFETGGLHVRLLIPPVGREPRWPTAAADGRTLWPKGEDELTARVYTIRRIDHARREVAIDIVLHGDEAAPGSHWASTAVPGDRVGLMGPGGGEIAKARRYVLAGDETALPAIARIAEGLPASARATAFIEIADAAEEQPLVSAAQLETVWLHRNGAAPGTTRLVEAALRGAEWSDSDDVFVFVGCEQAAARNIRSFLQKERGLAKKNCLVATYWNRFYQQE
jgi:NADPH-dependent ferric siderophore reductase